MVTREPRPDDKPFVYKDWHIQMRRWVGKVVHSVHVWLDDNGVVLATCTGCKGIQIPTRSHVTKVGIQRYRCSKQNRTTMNARNALSVQSSRYSSADQRNND